MSVPDPDQALTVAQPSKPARALPRRWLAVLGLVLFGSSLVGVAGVAGMVHWLDRRGDRVSVIEHEGDPPAAPFATVADRMTQPDVSASSARAPSTRVLSNVADAAPVTPDPALLTSAFARQQAGVQACFAHHAQGASAPPQLTLSFRVVASGEVEQTTLKPGQVASSPLGACLVELARSIRFPPLTHAVTFQIPLHARVAP